MKTSLQKLIPLGVFRSRRRTAPLVLVAALGLLFSGAGTAKANILVNGNLDSIAVSSQNNPSPTGWTLEAWQLGVFYPDGADSESWCNVADSGGYGLFFKPFQGTTIAGGMLSVYFFQDNSATAGTKFTLSGYAAGEANYCGFFPTNSPAPATGFFIEFLNPLGSSIVSNFFDLVAAGMPSGGPGSMSSFQYVTPEVTAPANTATIRAGVVMLNAYATVNPQSFFVDAFDLESTAPAGSPVITNQPVQVSVAPGENAVFTVGVSNTAGVSYQWQHANTNISNGGNISGANSATLTLSGVSASDVGHYRVLVSNSAGSVYSSDATLTMLGINFYPVISITGKIGDTYRVDYATALDPTNWIPFSTNKLTVSPLRLTDTSYPQDKARYYRAVFLY